MTSEERLNLLKGRIPDNEIKPTDNELNALLESAKGIIFENRFPYVNEYPADVEPKYHFLQVQMALQLYSKIGAEGEIAHTEGGIQRTYTSADISTDLIDRIIPMCGVL